MRERRRFPRYDIALPVLHRRKNDRTALFTADISRHGAFLRTDAPTPPRQLIQLTFRMPATGDLPAADIDAMCMVARVLSPKDPGGPGMGVDFFAISKEAKAHWDRFLFLLKQGEQAALFGPDPSRSTPPQPAPSSDEDDGEIVVDDAIVAVGDDDEGDVPVVVGARLAHDAKVLADSLGLVLPEPPSAAAPAPEPKREVSPPPLPPAARPPQLPEPTARATDAEPVRRAFVRHESCFLVRLNDRDALREFVTRDVSHGGMFLKTTIVREVGERVDLLIVHPDTDEEFPLAGTVVRRLLTGPVEERGLGIFFRALTEERRRALAAFIETGVESLAHAQSADPRLVALQHAVTREPESAEALEALGGYLLDEGDVAGALTALTRAVLLGPSVQSIHLTLQRAYQAIGYTVRARAHARVARALESVRLEMIGEIDPLASTPPTSAAE